MTDSWSERSHNEKHDELLIPSSLPHTLAPVPKTGSPFRGHHQESLQGHFRSP
ncbi:Hypothetical protein FKW44_007858 [Caligus rogercresseyi]|uniref:Uncharacterized protein n=1 Tax=Caligus rogercresseyi TaxID=217165 RepID=A0A7T8QTU6_CALRO|nr:Hypothetical protein FKW44_007858 [Caligus rogercresseyi]